MKDKLSMESDSKNSFSRSRSILSEPGIHEHLAELEMSSGYIESVCARCRGYNFNEQQQGLGILETQVSQTGVVYVCLRSAWTMNQCCDRCTGVGRYFARSLLINCCARYSWIFAISRTSGCYQDFSPGGLQDTCLNLS